MNRPSGRGLLLIVLAVAAGILVAISFSSQAQTSQGVLSYGLSPLQTAASAVGQTIGDAFRGPADLQTLRERNLELEAQVTDLTNEVTRLREFQAGVEEYRDLLKFSADNPTVSSLGADVIGPGSVGCNGPEQARPIGLVCARVVAADTNPYLRYVTINVGRLQGVRSGMPVVAGGLAFVGRIGQVSDASSQVQLLNDPRSFVNVVVQGSRVAGTVSGRPNGELVLQNVQQTESMGLGDTIVTSGLGGAIPPGLPIGQIEEVTSTDAQLFKEARIRPATDYTRLSAILVITSTSAPALLP